MFIIAAAVFFCIMACITTLLIREYYFFKNQIAQLAQIKDDYNNYVLALKRIIEDGDRGKELESVTNEKKKLNDREESFVVVNRELDYLRQSAVDFARLHNLDKAVQRMYQPEEQRTPRQRARGRSKLQKKPAEPRTVVYPENWYNTREALFAWPITRKYFWLSSPFGPRKKPNGAWGFHYGIDMAAVRGTPVKAAAAGIVIEACHLPGYGNTIVISHNKKFKTRYAHLAKILVHVGDKVEQGSIIGKVGDTGSVRGRGKDASHLHFEVHAFGKQVNPCNFLR